jgi:large subunit ribosomal protein L22
MAMKATARFIRMSPTKGRGLMNQIQGKPVEDAFSILKLSKKKASLPIRKVLSTAVSNAQNDPAIREMKDRVDTSDLFVKAAYIDGGPILHRIQHRAMGRIYRIRRRTSHITVELGLKNKKV